MKQCGFPNALTDLNGGKGMEFIRLLIEKPATLAVLWRLTREKYFQSFDQEFRECMMRKNSFGYRWDD